MARKKLSPLTEALLETAGDLHHLGIMDDATYRKITVRHLGKKAHAMSAPISPKRFAPSVRREFEPGGTGQHDEPDCRLSVAARARGERAKGAVARTFQRHPPQGNRGDSVIGPRAAIDRFRAQGYAPPASPRKERAQART